MRWPLERVSALTLRDRSLGNGPFHVLGSLMGGLIRQVGAVRIVKTEFKLPPVVLNMYWARRSETTPLQIYVRGVLQEIAKDIEARGS